MEHLRAIIGKNLCRMRRERGLSLDRTAELTGVSKAMLGQIERGESNPTVNTLWKIATGLGVSFTAFMEDETPSVSIISQGRINPLAEDGGRFRVYPLFPYGRLKGFEFYTVELEPGCSYDSASHNPGVEEYITVCQGILDLALDGEVYTVRSGEAIRFPADRPHGYRNGSGELARLHMLILYPEKTGIRN